MSAVARDNASAPLVYVRSTDYERTFLSAAGLLLGLLRQHPALRPSPTRPVTLHTEDDEANDIMHGVGLAASTKRSKAARNGGEGAESTRDGRCAAATRHAREQLSRWRAEPWLWQRLTTLFGETEMRKLLTTGIADALYARTCHELPLPCAASGCVDSTVQQAVWRDADAFYCQRYAGNNGGLASARLSMLPLLAQLVARLEATSSSPHAAPRLVLFSGHDTVVAPLLAAIGGLRAPGACRWPPYASHIAFELWEGQPEPVGDSHARRTRPLFVRVLFNGRAVTRFLDGCNRSAPREYCAWDDFAGAVRALRDEFTRTCGMEVPS